MTQIDRLSALMARFALRVEVSTAQEANLFVLQGKGDGAHVIRLTPRKTGPARRDPREIRAALRIDWADAENPLAAALPDVLEQSVDPGSDLDPILGLIRAEIDAPRCGGASVLGRLAEILIVRLLRARIEAGAVPRGMLGGLADPRLARALVAMHDRPGEAWSNDALARAAGMSRSRFIAQFGRAVGLSPQAYLRGWRLALARQDLTRGDRIDSVARRYGYGSGEALAHMVRRETGAPPRALRPA
ncbi:MAG: AraC family transcriptional regulator [Rhodobacteraceae bacterium]|nr:MAG: AraC family transcriptional regulator [Paracoccaceae bacterium]